MSAQLAYFLEKMEATKDLDGKSLLHNSQIVYGSGNSDGNRHSHSNLPVILAGHAGGALTPGRFTKFNDLPVTNLYLSMVDRIGGAQKLERFGDSTARLGSHLTHRRNQTHALFVGIFLSRSPGLRAGRSHALLSFQLRTPPLRRRPASRRRTAARRTHGARWSR